MTHTDLDRAFLAERRIERETETLDVRAQEVGLLTLAPLGRDGQARVFVGDPSYDGSADLALGPVAGGQGRARVSLIEARERATGRVTKLTAALRVDFGVGPVLSWRDVGTVGIDSGVCAFMAEAFAKDRTGDEDSLPLPGPGEMFATESNGFAVCSNSGFGDGGYGCFEGRDGSGRAVAFAVDFFVLVEPEEEVLEFDFAALSAGLVEREVLERHGLRLECRLGVRQDGQALLFDLDATKRTSDDVTSFRVEAESESGEDVFVGYQAQGLRWRYTIDASAAPSKVRLTFQKGVRAL